MPRRKSVRRKTLKRKGRKPTTRSNRKAMRRTNRKSMRRTNRKTMRRSNRKAMRRSNRKTMRRSNRKAMRRSNRKTIKGGTEGEEREGEMDGETEEEADTKAQFTFEVSGLTQEILNDDEQKKEFNTALKKDIAATLRVPETKILNLKIGDDTTVQAGGGENAPLSGTSNVTVTFTIQSDVSDNLEEALKGATLSTVRALELGDVSVVEGSIKVEQVTAPVVPQPPATVPEEPDQQTDVQQTDVQQTDDQPASQNQKDLSEYEQKLKGLENKMKVLVEAVAPAMCPTIQKKLEELMD